MNDKDRTEGENIPESTSPPSLGVASMEDAHRVPLREKIGYALGTWTAFFGGNGFQSIAKTVGNLSFGIGPASIGGILGFVRLWEAILNIIIGSISDNHRSKSGRRKPFIIWGGICSAVLYPAIWFASPYWKENYILLYFTAAALLFSTVHMLFAVPFWALGSELTADYEERTRIMSVRTMVQIGAFLIVPWIFPLSLRTFFSDPVTGIRVLTAISAVVMAGAAIVCGTSTRERYYRVASRREHDPMWLSTRSLLKDPVFLMKTTIQMGANTASQLVDYLGLYVLYFYVWKGNIQYASMFGAVAQNIGSVASIIAPIIIYKVFSRGHDKLKLLRACLFAVMLGACVQWLAIDQSHPSTSIIIFLAVMPALAACAIVTASMTADYLDYHEQKFGYRREGSQIAVAGLLNKIAGSIGVLISGLLLQEVGFDVRLGGAQNPETLMYMRIMLVCLPAGIAMLLIGVSYYYPLTQQRMQQIHDELLVRRSM